MIMLKSLFTLVMGIILFTSADNVQAEEEVVYDLFKGGEQTFLVETDDGEEIRLTVTEYPNTVMQGNNNSFGVLNATSSIVVGNTSYKISGQGMGGLIWSASYFISVKDRKITRAYNAKASAPAGGSFTSKTLQIISPTLARYSLTLKRPIIGSNTINLNARINNGKLYVEY